MVKVPERASEQASKQERETGRKTDSARARERESESLCATILEERLGEVTTVT